MHNAQHPLEGLAYILYFSIIIRWIAPKQWNNFLFKIAAKLPETPSTNK